jgi:hypothetical protein
LKNNEALGLLLSLIKLLLLLLSQLISVCFEVIEFSNL